MKQELIIQKKELPEGWKFVRLGGILEMNYGKGLTNAERKKGKIPVYGSNGVIDFNNDCLIDFNTIIIGRKGSAGELNFVERPCWPIDTTYYVATRYNLKFIYYLLKHINLKKITQKGAKPGLNRDEAYDLITIFTEDETEQQKIVSKLDRQMTQIEMMKKEAEKDLISSKELLNSILDNILFGVQSREWSKKKLGEVLKVKGGYAFKSHYFCNEGIPVIKISNVTNKVIDWTEKSYLPKKFMEEHKDFRITKGDILVAMTRPVTKSKIKVAIYQDNFDSLLNQRVGMLDFNEEINRQFLLYLMYSPSIREEFEYKSKTSQQPNISPSQIEDIDIMLPDKKTQEKVVFKINKLVEQTDLIVAAANSQLNTVNQLPSSILNEVFGQYEIPEEV